MNTNNNSRENIKDISGIVLYNGVSKNKVFVFLFQKTSKILNVLYRICAFIPESEPISLEIKNTGIALVKDIAYSVRWSEHGIMKREEIRKITTHLCTLVSFLDVARNAQYISQMNHSIVKEELVALMSMLDKNSEEYVVDKSEVHTEFVKDNQLQAIRKASTMNTNLYKGQTEKITASESQPRGMSERNNKIMGIIKDKKEVSIKDISMVLKDLSEKTVQRDLMTLISLGLIKKEGERRWSRYSLI